MFTYLQNICTSLAFFLFHTKSRNTAYILYDRHRCIANVEHDWQSEANINLIFSTDVAAYLKFYGAIWQSLSKNYLSLCLALFVLKKMYTLHQMISTTQIFDFSRPYVFKVLSTYTAEQCGFFLNKKWK